MTINVLDIGVTWYDDSVNFPQVKFLLDHKPNFDVYEKRPCDQVTLSSEQALIVGSTMSRKKPGWNIYWSEDDHFITFFTWGGKPDDGFGRWRRTIKLSDGSSEEIIGGWHVGPQAAIDAGFSVTVDTSYVVASEVRSNRHWTKQGGMACFITQERFIQEIGRLRPDLEVCYINDSPTVKWQGQISKNEFQNIDDKRRNQVREDLKKKYPTGPSVFNDWWNQATDEEKKELSYKKYSELGPVN
jgi:hypothetical protein